MRLELSTADLVSLDEAAIEQLRTGDSSTLHVLDAGSRRLRVGLTGKHGVALTARRIHLPDDPAADRWEAALYAQEAAVAAAGVATMPLGIQRIAMPGPARTLWILRGRVPEDTLLIPTLRGASPDVARRVATALLDAALGIRATDEAAVPSEASAWAWLHDELVLVHNDLPASLDVQHLYGPWRWWAPLLRGAWVGADAPLTSDPAVMLAGVLAPLALHASLEGVLPVLRPVLGEDARERVLEVAERQAVWSSRLQRLRRPR